MSQVYTWEMFLGSVLELTLWEPLWILRSPSRCIWGPPWEVYMKALGAYSGVNF